MITNQEEHQHTRQQQLTQMLSQLLRLSQEQTERITHPQHEIRQTAQQLAQITQQLLQQIEQQLEQLPAHTQHEIRQTAQQQLAQITQQIPQQLEQQIPQQLEQQLVTYENVTPNPITASANSIPDDAIGMDIIEGSNVNVKQYLRDNAEGLVFLSYTKYYPIEKEQLLNIINSNSSAIKYICANRNSVGSADKTVPYLNCKTLGLTTDLLVPLSQIKTMLTNNVRAVEIVPGDKKSFTVSLGVLNHSIDNWLGASHCQEGQGGTLSTLQELQNTISDTAISGGRKKRTKKSKRMNKRTKKRRINK